MEKVNEQPAMSEQMKMDAERALFEAWRLEKFCGGVERLRKCSNAPDVYYYSAEQEAWKVWQARASLPVGVPDGLLTRIDAAIKSFTSGRASMHVPPEPDDVDMVLGECWKLVNAIIAAPTVKAEQVPSALPERDSNCSSSGNNQHCRHDMRGCWWDENGKTVTGQECVKCGYCVTDVAGLAPSLPAAGSAVEEVEVVAHLFMKPDGKLSMDAVRHKPDQAAEPVMTVAQHERIVAGLRAQLREANNLADQWAENNRALSAQQSAPGRVSAPSYQQEYLDLLADVLEAKEAMREAGVKQADFPSMFAEFRALLAGTIDKS